MPGEYRGNAKVLEYADHLDIYLDRELACSYARPGEEVRNQRFSPEGMPKPSHGPRNRKRPTAEEEALLRLLSPSVSAYLDKELASHGIQRHQFIRRLLAMSRRMSRELFISTIERAKHYGVSDLETLERIAHLQMTANEGLAQPIEHDEAYRKREAYREGEFADRPDLSAYDDLLDAEE